MSKWMKKGDKVLVIAGNEKGKTGEILSRKGDKIRIQGLNIRKKHAKRKTRAAGAEILELEMPIHASNLTICNQDGQRIKLKVKADKDGNKELFYVAGGKNVTYRKISKTNP